MNQRVILITGANGALGQAFARSFLLESDQNQVWLGVRANRAAAEALEKEFAGRCSCIELDVKRPEAWRATVSQITAKHQRLDVLVNNAGRHMDSLLATMPVETWDDVVRTSLDGAFHG